jgi:putative inorganic carbon (hco3(-)) transporter
MRATPAIGAAPQRLAATQLRDLLITLGMALGLVVFYRASFQLPLTALGLAIFAACALLRPQLALLWVPLTAPLYLMPKGIWDERWGVRPEGLRLPLHEVVLLVAAFATALHAALRLFGAWRNGALFTCFAAFRPWLWRERVVLALAVLFLIGGTLGVVLALPAGRSEALRQWRWLVVEPLLFYGLARYWLSTAPRHPSHASEAAPLAFGLHYGTLLVAAAVLAGTGVAVVGLLQYIGYDLVPLIGQRVAHTDSVILIDGVRRVTAVYGNPNNLALFLGRTWPLAFVLTLIYWQRWQRGLWLACTVLIIGALLISFSRGANLAAVAAGGVLTWGLLRVTSQGRWRWAIVTALVALVFVMLGLFRDETNSGSASVRLTFWSEALAMLRDHPLGVGLGGFYFYHNPDYGQGYIAPELIGTSEQYAAHPHNLILDLALHVGPLGLLAMAGLVIVVLWRALRAQHTAAPTRMLALGVLASLVAALVHGLVDNFYFVPDLAIFFWLVVAISSLLAVNPSHDE